MWVWERELEEAEPRDRGLSSLKTEAKKREREKQITLGRQSWL